MSAQLLASKVVITEEPPRVPQVTGVPTAIVGAVGLTERGPIGVPTLVQSWEAFTDTFGGYTPNSDLSLAVAGFFAEGGTTLWVVRTVHYGDPTNPLTKTSAPASLALVDRAAAPAPTLRVAAKWDGAYGNDLTIRITAATSGAVGQFNLLVLDNGLVTESFPNLSLDPTSASYVETVVNDPNTGSHLIAVTDLSSKTAAPNNLPALGTVGPLVGGNDGLAGLTDADVVGSSAGKTGLSALNTVQQLSLLIVPGRATAAVQLAMLSYCEDTRNGGCFAVLDPPAGLSAVQIITYAGTTAAILGLSEFGAIYWPRVKVMNPSTTVFGTAATLVVPPSGHIAGVYSRIDGATPGGVYTPPAGIVNGILQSIVDFETTEVLDEAARDLVFPERINPLDVIAGTPRCIDGARTLKGDGNFPTVAERRGVIYIEQSLKQGLLFAKHANNTEALRARLTNTVTAFLMIQLGNGAFASKKPSEAFFVDFGDALNGPEVIAAGQVVGRIGLATAKPAEFVILKISQDTAALTAALAAATSTT